MDPITAGVLLSAGGGFVPTVRELSRTKPAKSSSADALGALTEALQKRTGLKDDDYNVSANSLEPSIINAITNPDAFASYGYSTVDGKPSVVINPNSDASMLAHELGHVDFSTTQLGKQIGKLKGYIPSNSLRGALGAILASGGVAAAIPGDDDLIASQLAATALAAPTLIDEFEASRRGLEMMNAAGVPITRGTRPRMAGQLMTYALLPAGIAGLTNAAVNNDL